MSKCGFCYEDLWKKEELCLVGAPLSDLECTRPKGHKGAHVACNISECMLGVWPKIPDLNKFLVYRVSMLATDSHQVHFGHLNEAPDAGNAITIKVQNFTVKKLFITPAGFEQLSYGANQVAVSYILAIEANHNIIKQIKHILATLGFKDANDRDVRLKMEISSAEEDLASLKKELEEENAKA